MVPLFEESQPLVEAGWDLATTRGRLVEISGGAGLSAAAALCAAAQAAGDSAAWVTPAHASFFPPDMAAAGVALVFLAVVRIPSNEAKKLARAATILAQSGGFGVIVIDLGGAGENSALSAAAQGRLCRLAIAHDAAIVCVTDKRADEPSLGSMVSLRIHTATTPIDGHCQVTYRALKDKRRGPDWEKTEHFRGPPGLR